MAITKILVFVTQKIESLVTTEGNLGWQTWLFPEYFFQINPKRSRSGKLTPESRLIESFKLHPPPWVNTLVSHAS